MSVEEVEERMIVAMLKGNRIGISLWKEGKIWYLQVLDRKTPRKAFEGTLVPILQLWHEDKRSLEEIMKDPVEVREIIKALIEKLPRDDANRFVAVETAEEREEREEKIEEANRNLLEAIRARTA